MQGPAKLDVKAAKQAVIEVRQAGGRASSMQLTHDQVIPIAALKTGWFKIGSNVSAFILSWVPNGAHTHVVGAATPQMHICMCMCTIMASVVPPSPSPLKTQFAAAPRS